MKWSAAVSADIFFAGLSIGDYNFAAVLAASLITAVITLTVCIIGFTAGEDLGRKLSDTAQLLSGALSKTMRIFY
ncbi:MAG: manganese efflux pump [Clostridiales bacterium]|nr:manganese efflux pump [Clostridiales bacterium]